MPLRVVQETTATFLSRPMNRFCFLKKEYCLPNLPRIVQVTGVDGPMDGAQIAGAPHVSLLVPRIKIGDRFKSERDQPFVEERNAAVRRGHEPIKARTLQGLGNALTLGS